MVSQHKNHMTTTDRILIKQINHLLSMYGKKHITLKQLRICEDEEDHQDAEKAAAEKGAAVIESLCHGGELDCNEMFNTEKHHE